jgi:hypothetical protein
MKYPWCKQDPYGTGNFEKVKCIICSRVTGMICSLIPKVIILESTKGGQQSSVTS